LTDEKIETLRDSCIELRDVAMIDLLSSTGMRVGELVKMNREGHQLPRAAMCGVRQGQQRT